MPKSIIFSAIAEADLDEIISYIAKDDVELAFRVADQIRLRCRRLSEYPESGDPVQELSDRGIRRLFYGNYVVYFRTVDDVVRILRVVHGARDISHLSFNE